ncbi:MAG: hypothetical protein HQ503_16670 [Rhodospirillales bacterium]|nr:hypothetical protein [Rhodospirillales bacterium]
MWASPMIPALNDQELENILEAAADAGAYQAGYILLRLPYEVKKLFQDWLVEHYPDRADHVLSLIRQCRGGALNDAEFGRRMVGSGVYAQLLKKRFEKALKRFDLEKTVPDLDSSSFLKPLSEGPQMALF